VLITNDVALGTRALVVMESGHSVGAVLVRFPPNTSVSRLCSVVVDAVGAGDVAAIGTLAVLSPNKVRIRTVDPRSE
jgi:sugar/nucleoside kinase (ribokinase family)